MLVFIFIFWICLFLIIHSYILFPLILSILSRDKKINEINYNEKTDDLPTISILLAVYNEAKVIEEKINSTFKTNYPLNKIEFLIGSDASIDSTNKIIEKLILKYPAIQLILFEGRTGKSGIINQLADIAKGEILLLTDANVFFNEETIFKLVKHFKNQKIGQVGANIINSIHKKEGISFQEKSYLQRENLIKFQEGVIWGCMIGAFGGCYAIRRKLFVKVPPNFLMDDFFISMNVLAEKHYAINELNAQCFEDVSNKITEEFRRKVRISAGNFQNLNYYRHLLFKPLSGIAFCFFSHKVIRWITPFLLVILLLSTAYLSLYSNFYQIMLFIFLISILIPIIDSLLKAIHIHIKIIRFVTHFYLMNLALLIGFFQYKKGINTNVWKPTQRNQ